MLKSFKQKRLVQSKIKELKTLDSKLKDINISKVDFTVDNRWVNVTHEEIKCKELFEL